jgi:hypothetical protein
MKGIVFTEFLDLVGRRYGEEMMDRIIEESHLPSGAAYTCVGTYDHAELIAMVAALSRATDTTVADFLRMFGEHLFGSFAKRYPQFFTGIGSSFDFLDQVEEHIHVEVRKLYPDAELPTITCSRRADGRMELVYRSTRPFASFAEGLMRGAIAHFKEDVDIVRLSWAADDTSARFELRRS